MKVVGVDVGGTFTDVVLADLATGALSVEKLPTTPTTRPRRWSTASRAWPTPADARPRCATARPSPPTRCSRPPARASAWSPPRASATSCTWPATSGRSTTPSARRCPGRTARSPRARHRKTVRERLVPPRGEVLVPLDEDGVRAAARELRDEGVEAVAVCFLFSYLDPVHEERAAEIVREEHPDAFVTTSSSVYPQFREFERFTTAAANAYVGPPVRAYLERLAERAAQAGFGGRIHVMRSNGGVAPRRPGRARAGDAAALRAGRRRARRRARGPRLRSRPPRHLRRRRHVGRHRRRHRQRPGRGLGARHLHRGLPDHGADARPGDDRRRRRLHRLRRRGRRLPRRARARPARGPARRRTATAARSRRSPTPTSCSAGSSRSASSAARCGSTRRGDGGRARARRRLGLRPRGGGAGHPDARSTPTWRTPSAA